MVVQPRQHWITDYSSLFLWGVSTCQFFSNSKTMSTKQGGQSVLDGIYYMIWLICLLICQKNNRFSLLNVCLRKTEDCGSEYALNESDETLLLGRSATSCRLSLQ